MLQQQQTISFSDYSSLYDLIIPKDNLLRQINELVDFSCFRHWDTQISRLGGHIDQIIKFTLFLIHSKYPLHGLLGSSMNVADSIHVLCKFLRTMYGYVRFGSLQYSFQLQQYRVGREANTDVSLNAVT